MLLSDLQTTGDPWEDMGERAQSLEPLLQMYESDPAAGLGDAPWPPVYPKMPNEPPRVAPSRARKENGRALAGAGWRRMAGATA